MSRVVRKKRSTPKPEIESEAVASSDAYIRRWALSRGLCSAKGRIPAKARKAFEERGAEDVILDDQEDLVHKGKEVTRFAPTGKTNRRRAPCGFCSTGSPRHDYCPGIVLNGKHAPKPAHICLCFEKDPKSHPKGMQRAVTPPYAQYAGHIVKEIS